MRGKRSVQRHAQTSGCGQRLAALALLAATATFAGAARAQEAPVDGSAIEPYVLAADRVRYWNDGPRKLVLLEGRAAIMQGLEGIRADRAVVAIDEVLLDEAQARRLEVYAEGNVRTTDDSNVARSLRLSRTTGGEVRLMPHGSVPPTALVRPPVGLGLLARAFPPATAVTAAPPQPPAPPATASPPKADEPRIDPAVQRAQFGDALPEPPIAPAVRDEDAFPLQEPAPANPAMPGEAAEDLPQDIETVPPSEMPARPADDVNAAPILPGSRRIITISPRDRGGQFAIQSSHRDNQTIVVIRGGVNVIAEFPGPSPDKSGKGTVDISADSAVLWLRDKNKDGSASIPSGGGVINQDDSEPLEAYLEGHVVFLQDARKYAGTADQKRIEGPQLYYDFRTEWALSENAEFGFFAPGLLAPLRLEGQKVQQFRPILGRDARGQVLYGPTQIRADRTTMTGSRFPVPGYKFNSRSVDLTQVDRTLTDPVSGQPAGNPKDPRTPQEQVWHIDARSNVYFIGAVPVFYWPKVEMDSDDLDPPIRNLEFRANNYFGQQILTDWNMFKVLNLRRPNWIDTWNFDVDYLSYRTKQFPALGSEIGWFGRDLVDNLLDPYNQVKNGRRVNYPYYGYLDLWGLRDSGRDDIGPGPAVVTTGPPGAGKAGYQALSVPSFVPFRGRAVFRHMQRLIDPDTAEDDEDSRLQLEYGQTSDRYFELQYFKMLFNTGLDNETLANWNWQRENQAMSLLTEGNLMPFYTESQWLPKFDYYRLGDSFLGNLLSYSQNSGVDYANTHTANEVNNPNIFAFLPYDPVSNTSGTLKTGRLWTSHELDMPLNFEFLRIVPYVQGQYVGWNEQLAGSAVNRIWGGAGARANVMLWKTFPNVESELLNVHGLSHKVNFDADFRTTYSNVHLNRLGIQDDLDTNSYEFVRRYFALTNYVGGLLPLQYDPRFLTLRRAISPIAGTTDIQDSIETLQLGIRQRLQTKRGPEGKRRIVDWMTLDLTTTYFPDAHRDNFGKPFGQNQYNWEWFIGDRTSILSYGWFEFFKIAGNPILISNPRHSNQAFGLDVITTGISVARPPRGNVFIGYSVINTGPIATSALTTSVSYWMSPKWYGSVATSYDFGNAILLGSSFTVTKIGADFLTSIGLNFVPLQRSVTFGFEISPRLSPSIRLGSNGGGARFDQRFAPTQ
jgi:hypothetical protein